MRIPRSATVIAPDGLLDAAGLQRTIDLIAVGLSRAGVKSGSVVALMLPNTLAFVPTYLALRSLDVTVALIPPKYGVAELDGIRRGVHPAAFVTPPAAAPGLAPERVVEVERLAVAFTGDSGAPIDAAVLKFTSGSTGTPKGIALTAKALDAEADNVVTSLLLDDCDRILAPVPLCHSYGFDLGVLTLLRAGCTLAIEDTFIPRRLLAELASGRVSIFLGVPAMYRAWLALPPAPSGASLPVRYLLSCTAPLPAAVVTAFHARYHTPICQHYGSSETGAVTTHVPDQVLARPDSVGRPMGGGDVSVRIVDGEVVVSSSALARGYVMGAPPDRQPFQLDGYHTGDRGRLQDGFLYIDGRLDDLINVGGFKVSPREVIDALESFPAVAEAAVVGVRDGRGEEVVYAVVALSGATTEAEILAHCRARLAEYKVPRRVEIRPSLPRGPTGKVQLRAEDVRV